MFEWLPVSHALAPPQATENPPYEPVRDLGALKELLAEKLEDYALEPGNSQMDLVLFQDALQHICRCVSSC